MHIDFVKSYDVHSKAAYEIQNFENQRPGRFHSVVDADFKPNIVFYPDEGAARRYTRDINRIDLYGAKVRDQLSGEITGYKLCNLEFYKDDLAGSKILIVDDICDGGATFITAAKELMKYNPKEIALCVSHGLFSKGFFELNKSGINRYYTTNSLGKFNNNLTNSLQSMNCFVFNIEKGKFV
jgi:ribose-phosphate pyrophosphokinase